MDSLINDINIKKKFYVKVKDLMKWRYLRHVKREAIKARITSKQNEPEVLPDVSPDVSPEVSPKVLSEVSSDVSPDVLPDVSPDVSPDVPLQKLDISL
jgi:hypothetical protein